MKKSVSVLITNMFNACKKNNYNYIEKNRDRLTFKLLLTKDEKGNSALYMATANKHLDCVRYLLERGFPINTRNENGNTVLHKAFQN